MKFQNSVAEYCYVCTVVICTLIEFKICRTMQDTFSKVGQKYDILENLVKSRTCGRYARVLIIKLLMSAARTT